MVSERCHVRAAVDGRTGLILKSCDFRLRFLVSGEASRPGLESHVRRSQTKLEEGPVPDGLVVTHIFSGAIA